jgi:hypothetical protein
MRSEERARMRKAGQRILEVRISTGLYKRLGMAAVHYERSRSGLVRSVMLSWLDREEKKRLTPPA